MNIEVYRTDKHGEISLTIGQKIIINKYRFKIDMSQKIGK